MVQEEKEGLKLKICCACKKEKDINNFYRNIALTGGREHRCKLCKRAMITCRQVKPKKLLVEQRGLILSNLSRQDWIDAFKFLEKLGYDLNQNLHEQFCDKHGLKPRKRMKEKSKQYSPKELGMV